MRCWCVIETSWCPGDRVFLPIAFYHLLTNREIWKLMSNLVKGDSNASNAGEKIWYRYCITHAGKTAGAHFGQKKHIKVRLQCARHTRITVGTRWVSKGKKILSLVGFLTSQKPSNQGQGCSQGADEKYLRLIILAWKLMVGKRRRRGRRIKYGSTWTSWEDFLKAPLRVLSLFLSCFLLLLEWVLVS